MAGGIFSRITLISAAGVRARSAKTGRRGRIVFAALCGFAVAAVGYFSGGLTYGTGYSEAHSVARDNARQAMLSPPKAAP